MTKPLKITVITLSTLIALSIIGYYVADAIISSKLENFLKTKLPETVSLDYQSVDINLWNGSLIMVRPTIVNKEKHSSKVNADIALDTLIVEGFGYWNYLVNNNIHVRSIQLRSPRVHYKHDQSIPKNEHKNSSLDQLQFGIKVDRFNVQNGTLRIRDMQTDSIVLYSESLNANIMGIILDDASLKKRIPFNYGDYNLSFNDLFYSMGDYENLTIALAEINQEKMVFTQMKMFTKYSKAKLNQIISIERDHFDVTIPSLVLNDQEFGFNQDSIFYFRSPKIIFYNPKMYIYRNKLLADDTTRKYLYSKMIRDMTYDLTLSEIQLVNTTIVYSEKVNLEMPAGKLSFSDLNANIKNISNTYGAEEKTTLDIDAVFMAKTPIHVIWEFDVNDVNDTFIFKTDIGKLPSPDLNPFSQPNLKVKLEGELLHTYATISGDDATSRVTMRANYEDFKVVILDKEGEKKNKVLSALANLFIKKSSDKENDGFRESFKDEIERDKTKSIFNFLWLNLKAGLASIMTGNGKQ